MIKLFYNNIIKNIFVEKFKIINKIYLMYKLLFKYFNTWFTCKIIKDSKFIFKYLYNELIEIKSINI